MGSSVLDAFDEPEEIDISKMYRRDFLSSSHGIHKYTAMMTPPISRYLIEKYSKEGELVFDPFCGSGTTLLEAHLFNRRAVGIDLNPLAALIAKVKSTPIENTNLKETIKAVHEKLSFTHEKIEVSFPNINHWFCRKAIDDLGRILFCINEMKDEVDNDTYDFLRVSFSSIVRKSSNADLRMAKTYKSKRVLEKIQKGWVPDPIAYYEETLERNSERILRTFQNKILNYDVLVLTGDARESSLLLKQNFSDDVDLVITSPPYINAQDYFRSYKLELWWLGLARPNEIGSLKRKAIGSENVSNYNCKQAPTTSYPLLKTIVNEVWNRSNPMSNEKAYIITQYFDNMRSVIDQLHRCMKKKGILCLITGNNTICGVTIPTYKIIKEIAGDCGFKHIKSYRDKIKNRSLFPVRNHSGGVIGEECITIFENVSS